MAPPKAPKLPLCRLFSDTCKISEKFAFFRNPSHAPGMGLGDDLVTIRVLELSWGPTLWPLGLCSPCHGPPKSFKITSQRLLDQSQAGVYMGKTPHTPHFGPIRVPYPKGLNC